MIRGKANDLEEGGGEVTLCTGMKTGFGILLGGPTSNLVGKGLELTGDIERVVDFGERTGGLLPGIIMAVGTNRSRRGER